MSVVNVNTWYSKQAHTWRSWFGDPRATYCCRWGFSGLCNRISHWLDFRIQICWHNRVNLHLCFWLDQKYILLTCCLCFIFVGWADLSLRETRFYRLVFWIVNKFLWSRFSTLLIFIITLKMATGANKTTPIFFAHGDADAVCCHLLTILPRISLFVASILTLLSVYL